MSETNREVTSAGTCFTGMSKDENGNEISNADLWNDDSVLDTDDPGFQKYCQSELDLLAEVERKYADKDHGLLKTYMDSLYNDTLNLKNGIAMETNICAALFNGSTGLTKMKDVIVDLESKDRNMKDPLQSNFKDTKVYEEAAQQFGITSLYEEYNAAIKTSVAWQKEWQSGEPDPEKLEAIGGKIFKNIEAIDKYMKHFETEYIKDARLPDSKRNIYNITNRTDAKKRDLIATEMEFATDTSVRAPNGKNWRNKKVVFEREFEKQLLAAKLMKLQKSIDGAENPELKENMQKLIRDCTRARRDLQNGERVLPEADHAALLKTVQEQASSLADKNPAAKGIVEATKRYMNNPVNQINTADKWIESYQKNGFQKTGKDGRSVVDTDRFADIMAARMLANSVRGNKKSLGKEISVRDITDKANELKNDPTFKGFLDKLKANPKAMQKALSAAKSGHGGGLDDMLRDHVKNLPAGQLSNTPLMERYLPTVRERIEALQARVAKDTMAQDLHKTAAEIIALRNLAHAERGKKKTLDKAIPIADADKDLKVQTDNLGRDRKFSTYCNKENRHELMALITEGHGGMMTERLREQNLWTSSDSWDILYGNSIRGRIDAIKQEVQALRENPPKTDDLREKAGKLLAEYLTLDVLSRDPKTAQTDPMKLDSDVPYSRMDKAVEMGFTKQPHFNNFMKSIDDETLRTTFLDDIVTKKQDTLVMEVGTKITEIQQKSAERDTQPRQNKELDVQKAPQNRGLGG